MAIVARFFHVDPGTLNASEVEDYLGVIKPILNLERGKQAETWFDRQNAPGSERVIPLDPKTGAFKSSLGLLKPGVEYTTT